MTCKLCGQEPNGENVATPAGKREFCNTEICEKCFDNSTFDMSCVFDVYPDWLYDLLGDDCWVAGGSLIKAVRHNHEANDIDLFFRSQEAFERTTKLIADRFGQKPTENDKVQSFICDRQIVQLIGLQYYDDMQALIDDFDIHACACAFDGRNIVKHRGFVFDNLNRFINLNEIKRPKRVLSRICKYVNKGYSLTPSATRFYTESLINMSEVPEEPETYLSTGSWRSAL